MTVKRRLSKVKNPERVFCNNQCRARFTEREKLKQYMLTDTDFLTEINDKELQRVASISIHRAFRKYSDARKYSFSDLWQEICIAVWKYGKRANNGKGEKYGFYRSTFDKALLSFFQDNDWNVQELCLDDALHIYASEPDIDIIGVKLVKEIEDKAKKKKNWLWFRDYYLKGFSSSQIAEHYKVNMREVVCAVSYLKKALKKKYG